jgi:hypothetical protein
MRRIVGRGSRGLIVFLSLAITAAAAGAVFSLADVLTLGRVPYSSPSELASIQVTSLDTGISTYIRAESVGVWATQKDLFSDLHAFDLELPVQLDVNGTLVTVPTASVTPGLVEMLGAHAQYGRTLDRHNTGAVDGRSVLISAQLARTIFGSPIQAVGRSLKLIDGEAKIIGVMPDSFRFPRATVQLWYPLDLRNRGIAHVQNIGRLARGVDKETATLRVRSRTSLIPVEAASSARPNQGNAATGSVAVVGLAEALGQNVAKTRQLLLLLEIACGLLFAIAIANALSFELGVTLEREHQWAIQSSLGGSLPRILASSVGEAFILAASSATLAWAVAGLGLKVLDSHWPVALVGPLSETSLTSVRALSIGGLCFCVSWLALSLPSLLRAPNPDYSSQIVNR